MIRILKTIALMLLLGLCPAQAEELTALARVDAGQSQITEDRHGVELRLTLSQPVPYSLHMLADPTRLVVDFREVSWGGVTVADLVQTARVTTAAAGPVRPGLSRLVLGLDAPYVLRTGELRTDTAQGKSVLTVRLDPASAAELAAQATRPEALMGGQVPSEPQAAAQRRQDGSRPLRVVLDPGHGGVDPGAERDGVNEADLMLIFAREAKEVLLRDGFEVVLTRNDDSFVPLETRISIARAAKADVFLSLHADALSEGQASGATIYTLSDTASDKASAQLAERHDRADLLAGVDLSEQDDVIAGVLMGLARVETTPRAGHLADALVLGLRDSIGRMHKRPRLSAGFSVLKAPDIPSALIELGFLSSPQDLDNLRDPDWRARAAMGISAALQSWALSDAAEARLLRQ